MVLTSFRLLDPSWSPTSSFQRMRPFFSVHPNLKAITDMALKCLCLLAVALANAVTLGMVSFAFYTAQKGRVYALETDVEQKMQVLQQRIQNATQHQMEPLQQWKTTSQASTSALNQKQQQRITVETRLSRLQQTIATLKRDLEQATQQKQVFTNQNQIQSQQLRPLQIFAQNLTEEKHSLGPIHPLYACRPAPRGDEDYDPALHDPDQLENQWAASYKKVYPPGPMNQTGATPNNFHTMQGLMEGAFKDALNRHSLLVDTSEGYLFYICSNMIINLVSQANIEHDDCHGQKLMLNNAGLSVASSRPYRVVTYNTTFDPQKPQATRQRQVITLLEHTDEWGPQVPGEHFPRGVDPISLKWILLRLTAEEKKHLDCLLGEDIFEDTVDLAEARRFVTQDTERSKLVKTAVVLTRELARSVSINFATSFSSLRTEWT